MWKLDHKESWVPKNWCFWTVVLQKTFESSLDCKIKAVNPKGSQFWIFTGRADAEAEAPILWSPDGKSWLIKKTRMLGKIEGRRRKGWQRMRWLDGITNLMDMSLSKLRGVGNGQGSLACWSPQGRRVRCYWATELNWTDTKREGGVTGCHRLPGAHQTPESMWQCFDLVAVHVGPVICSCTPPKGQMLFPVLQLFISVWMIYNFLSLCEWKVC